MRRSTRKVLALLPALALAATACGVTGSGKSGSDSSGDGSGSSEQAIPEVAKDDKLAAMVPQDIRADGKIAVGHDQSYPPNEFVNDDNQVVGMNVDLGRAIGQKLGLDVTYQNATFEGIISGLAAGKYEMANSSFTINEDRLEQVDMVSYFTAGTLMATRKGNPQNLNPDNLCGHTVAVQKGTVQVPDLRERSAECTKQGKKPIDIKQNQLQTEVNLALTAERADAMFADSPVVDYAVKQTNGQIEVVGEDYDTAPYGVALPKGKGDYAKAVQGAIQSLMDDGTYMKILEKWNVQRGAIEQSEVNPASES